MKFEKLRDALESLKGSVSKETDAVMLTGQIARVTDGQRWAEATLPNAMPAPMTLRYSKFRSIVRTLGEEAEIEIEPNGPTCGIKAPDILWQLNLLNVPIEPLPEFPVIKTIEASGRVLLEAYKSLKHLIHTHLSKPSLMWAWTNESQQLVIGDGARLGGYQTGIKDLELPLTVLSEICRIMAVHLSEKVIFEIGEKHIRATMHNGYFQAMMPIGPRFEVDWYNKVSKLLSEDPQVINVPRKDLLRAIKQVAVTAGESTTKLTQGNGTLILLTKDEYGNKSGSKIEASGSLKEPIHLNVDHLSEATEVLTEEMISVKVCKSVVELSDKKRWEIISQR